MKNDTNQLIGRIHNSKHMAIKYDDGLDIIKDAPISTKIQRLRFDRNRCIKILMTCFSPVQAEAIYSYSPCA